MNIVADVLTLLQGIKIPRLLRQGQIHDGMHVFIATSASGSALTANMLQGHPEMKQHSPPWMLFTGMALYMVMLLCTTLLCLMMSR